MCDKFYYKQTVFFMNRHIKLINGRKYYYSSIRKGKKVTSKYLGPVERVRKSRKDFSDAEQKAPQETQVQEEQIQDTTTAQDEENYIG